MLRICLFVLFVFVVVFGAGEAYLKAWEDGAPPQERSSVGGPPSEQRAMLDRLLQTYLDDGDRPRGFAVDSDELPPSKRQMRYNQCYFNPISCFRK